MAFQQVLGMPELLHEYWENETGGEFGPVRERNDQLRPRLLPNSRKIFELWAECWYQAMQLHNERLGYGDYVSADGIPDHHYTEEEEAEQRAYLAVRNVP